MRDNALYPAILFIGLSAKGHGGIQRFNRRVIDSLAILGRRTAVAMRADDPRARFAATTLAALVRAEVVLIGHINLLPLALLIRLVRPRVRVVLFAHGIEVWGDSAYRPARRWERALLRLAVNRVAVVSRFSMKRMAAAFGLDEAKFVLFPNAVDLLEPPAQESGDLILAVARLGAGEREKHVDKLVRALPFLSGARLMVIGDGPLRQELRDLAASLGVGERVELPGAVDEAALARAYAQARVFALPSSKEGFGIVYLEAWARGLPVIGSRFGGAGEVITDGVDGFTVDPEDGRALVAAFGQLLRDPALASRMGATGRRKVEELYSGAAFTRNLAALL
ncbi:glycosyltransferase family 4 protein [Sphingomonas mucosissima]|uniref:GDP-mannose-dependent alpha-(1-6)-phosphatidylinositol monomannoside mannosyltransferase n=1 Tax=Sphingomonas mucosissima TaxID=370959 RepID=A0A245ZH83_9SPHN|nr:glycosyltransferase family 4 protein [Sphingomonas mucosissima]OWK29106.1 GDP-mannose-dependent alpha-(1-6)-phosphatidylinositol monomannoside mannosyltransferase [Sphingomonas mucosissima]